MKSMLSYLILIGLACSHSAYDCSVLLTLCYRNSLPDTVHVTVNYSRIMLRERLDDTLRFAVMPLGDTTISTEYDVDGIDGCYLSVSCADSQTILGLTQQIHLSDTGNVLSYDLTLDEFMSKTNNEYSASDLDPRACANGFVNIRNITLCSCDHSVSIVDTVDL